MFFRLKGGPHLFQSCLCLARNSLPLVTKEMHLSFKNLVLTNALSLQISLMDIHHDASFRSILEDDFIF